MPGYLFLCAVLMLKYFKKSQKDKKMKKFFAIAVIAASFVACNNSGDKNETKDTTAVKVDTPAVVTPDTTAPVAPDTTVVAAPDTTKK